MALPTFIVNFWSDLSLLEGAPSVYVCAPLCVSIRTGAFLNGNTVDLGLQKIIPYPYLDAAGHHKRFPIADLYQ